MRGRKRLPTATLEASGAYKKNPQRRDERANEPEPEAGAAKPPGMSLEAERHWPVMAKILEDAGVLTRMDGLALGVYCETYARWRDALDAFNRQRVVSVGTGKTRKLVPNPQHDIADKAQSQLVRLMTEFGMTPASRSKVSGRKKAPGPNRFGAIAKRGRGEAPVQ